MSTTIRVQMLGRPKAWINGEVVHFPFKQAEALFYYLLLEREAAKDVLAEVIWESSEGMEKAQSSMRNGIYVLRKTFGRELLTEPVKNILEINPQFRPDCDVDLLSADGELPPDFYKGDFLEGFYLKKSVLYNDWVESKRREIQSRCIKRITAQIAASLEGEQFELCEQLCDEMLRIDSYDDTAYLSLMECYRRQEQYAKAAAIYERMEAMYREELFEEPTPRMREASRKLWEQANAPRQTPPPGRRPAAHQTLFGREEELRLLRESIDGYFSGEKPPCLLLTGETGVGKTRMVEELQGQLSRQGNYRFCHATCFQMESKYALRPWQTILRALEEQFPEAEPGHPRPEDPLTQYADVETACVRLFGKMEGRYRLVFCFDDLQWADDATTSLIMRLASDRDVQIFFLLLLQEEAVKKKYMKDFLSRARYSGQMDQLALDRLGQEDTVAMVHALLPSYPFTRHTEHQFYRETEGNPLFIVELANSIRCDGSLRDISPNIRELIGNRIANVPAACRSLLELLSLFYSGASFDLLKSLSQKGDVELLEELEYLTEYKFIREASFNGEAVYKFTHQKIPEYIYGAMSQAKRKVFHRKAGAYYETLLRQGHGSSWLYTYLIHHYERAGLREKYLEYTINYIHAYLGMAHEYFPVVDPAMMGSEENPGQTLTNVQGLGMHITMDEILELLAEYTVGLPENPSAWEEGTRQVISRCYHLLCRYCVQSCRYEEGLKYIFRLKQVNREATNAVQLRNLLSACKQQLYIYINRYDTKGMSGALEEAFSLLPLLGDPMETAVWTRMRGMWRVMCGQAGQGAADLEKAITLFRDSGESRLFLYNLAAAYAWLGEARRHLFDSDTADAYYQQAINTCESYFWIGGVALFYTYAGMNAYDSGKTEQARSYLESAVESYDQSSFLWGRGLALGYLSLLRAEDGDCAAAGELLRSAEQSAAMFGSRYEQGVLLRIKAQLRARMETDLACREAFSATVTESAREYSRQARVMLRGVFSPADSLYLSKLDKIRDFS